MKTIHYKKLFSRLAALLMLPALLGLASCKEDIDESNLYTFTGETIEDYLANREDQFSNFNYILKRAGLDKLMASYGTYTCFAPVNDAVTAYVDSLYADMSHEDLPHNGMTGPGLEGLTDSLCNDIAKFHLVNQQYMAVDMGKNITITSMLGREMNTSTDSVTGNTVVNAYSQIISIDNELENGVVHVIDHVLTRSNSLIFGEMSKHEEFTIFTEALQLTGLADSLNQYKKDKTFSVDNTYNFYVPTECLVGFTIFAETDAVLKVNGITSVQDLAAYANKIYEHCADPGTGWYDYYRNNNIQVSTGTDYESPYNCLNMFMRYHIIKYKIPYDHLVYTGLNESSSTVTFYEYNETMLPYTLLKIWAKNTSGDRLINHWEQNNTLNENDSLDVDKISDHVVLQEGATIMKSNYQQPLNGYIHRITGIIAYDANVPQGVLNERMRFDDTALFPEMMSNGFRCATYEYIRGLNGGVDGSDGALGGAYIRIPTNFFDHLKVYNGETTRFYYLSGSGNTWSNYQKDEFNCMGAFDFALRLPPVPDGTYEIRMGYTANGNRGMMQVYMGETNDVTKMKAMDIPLDMRNVPSTTNNTSAANIATGWTLWTNEADKGVQTDKDMHNLGWMRGPLYYTVSGSTLARSNAQDLRRIIAKVDLQQREYWLRFKTVLPENTTTQFHLDYIEIVPANIYNNASYLEDMY